MTLLELQRSVARAVMQPLTASGDMRATAADGSSLKALARAIIKPNDRLSAVERLEIYNRQYWYRVLAALEEDFPGLLAVVGRRRFDALAVAYLNDCPSRSFTLRNLGARLPAWLQRHAAAAGPRAALALDMARLEWAQIDAFDGPSAPPLTAEDVAALAGRDVSLPLQPWLHLLRLRYPVDDLLIRIQKRLERGAASNAAAAVSSARAAARLGRVREEAVCLAVYRNDESIYLKRLSPEAFAFLRALRRGGTIAEAAAAALRRSRIPAGEFPTVIGEWFQTWSALGWFGRPAQIPPCGDAHE